MDILLGILDSISRVVALVWWFVLPIFLFYLAWKLHLIFIRLRYIKSIEWSTVELKIPKNILKSPKSMEQIFAEMAAIYSFGLTTINVYIEGKVEPWVSFEMVGYAGGVHFYAYFPSKYRNLLESTIYAYYPDAEIHPAEDYTELLGSVLPNKTYDLWGTDLILTKENYYPIKTYPYFEETVEERRVDPIAAITETMSNLEEGEMIWLQILISPTGNFPIVANLWKEEGIEKIEEIAGRKTGKAKKGGLGAALLDWTRNLFWAPVEYPVWPGAEGKEALATLRFLHPAEQEVVKAIGNKISKFGFETITRFIYIDRRDSFTQANVSAVLGAFHQFRLENLNAFRPNKKTMTLKTGWLAKLFPFYKRLNEFSRKRRIFDAYVRRRFGRYNKTRPEKFPVLNTEELATIYHFPTAMVEAPRLEKLEAKKGGPPPTLPVE